MATGAAGSAHRSGFGLPGAQAYNRHVSAIGQLHGLHRPGDYSAMCEVQGSYKTEPSYELSDAQANGHKRQKRSKMQNWAEQQIPKVDRQSKY